MIGNSVYASFRADNKSNSAAQRVTEHKSNEVPPKPRRNSFIVDPYYENKTGMQRGMVDSARKANVGMKLMSKEKVNESRFLYRDKRGLDAHREAEKNRSKEYVITRSTNLDDELAYRRKPMELVSRKLTNMVETVRKTFCIGDEKSESFAETDRISVVDLIGSKRSWMKNNKRGNKRKEDKQNQTYENEMLTEYEKREEIPKIESYLINNARMVSARNVRKTEMREDAVENVITELNYEVKPSDSTRTPSFEELIAIKPKGICMTLFTRKELDEMFDINKVRPAYITTYKTVKE